MRPSAFRQYLLRRLTVVLLTLVTLVAILPPAQLVRAAEDYALPSGQFFTQTGDGEGTGFAVGNDLRDEAGRPLRFWSEFQRLGGIDVLGYPVSRVYRESDGFYYQLFQRALLQWRPEADAAVFANMLDEMSDAGADHWLASRGIPVPIPDDKSGGDFTLAVQTRLGWLAEPHIRAAYLALGSGDARAAIDRYGLPTSLPLRSGPFTIQRFQRIALQVWLDSVPGMPAPGAVVPVLTGELYREQAIDHGIGLADGRFVAEGIRSISPPSSGRPPIIDDGLQQPLELLAANPEGGRMASALRSPGVRVGFEEMPAIALFSATELTVAVDTEWRDVDPMTLSAVLAHEGSHLADFLAGDDMDSSAGCYQTEWSAFEAQASVWQAFYGPGGKAQPENDLDTELNRILHEVKYNPDGFAADLVRTYHSECEGGRQRGGFHE